MPPKRYRNGRKAKPAAKRGKAKPKASRAKGSRPMRGKGRGKNTKVRSSHRKKSSSVASFARKVERALGGEHQFVNEGHVRVGGSTGVQYTGLATNQLLVLADVPTIYNFIWDIVQRIYYFPAGQSAGGFVPGVPLDFHLTKCQMNIQVTNVSSIPVFGTLWQLAAKYDCAITAFDAYTNSLGGMSTAKYDTPDDTDKNSTPFRYRDLCQVYKIMKPTKFKLEAGGVKRFKFDVVYNRHIFNRYGGLDAIRGTRYFYFNFLGPPINDTATVTNVNTAATQCDITWQSVHEYATVQQPYRFRDVNTDVQAVAAPRFMTVNVPTAQAITQA